MQVDFAIELGADDETLEFPWVAAEAGPRYYDLKRHPELLLSIAEASRFSELAEFLSAVNSPTSLFETAKCDAWSSTEMKPEEDIFGATCKFGSYVDLVLSSRDPRVLFSEHEQLLIRPTELLKRVPEIPAAAEFLVRRCYYTEPESRMREGFYVTTYVFGYGDDELQSRQQWAIGMKLVENALRQSSMTGK